MRKWLIACMGYEYERKLATVLGFKSVWAWVSEPVIERVSEWVNKLKG